MVTKRRCAGLGTAVLTTIAAFLGPALARGDAVRLTDATERGTFTVGAARASVAPHTDASNVDVLRFDYALPRGTAAGVWAKSFPNGLRPDAVDVALLAAKGQSADDARYVSVAVEIKGTRGTQQLPLRLGAGWSRLEAVVDWSAIGQVTEVVVSLARAGDVESATGSVLLDVRFERLTGLRRLATLPPARIAGVAIVAMLAGFLTALMPRGFPTLGEARGFRRDLVQGVGVVAVAALGVFVYALGERGPLEVGWTALGVALAGAAVAEWWKFGLAGRHLTAGEVACNVFATGVLAASASSLAVLQAPAAWSDALLLSRATAAAALIAYHAANAHSLTTRGRHMPPTAGAMIVGTPYVVGGLMLLRANGLMSSLGAGNVVLGRAAVLFAFNAVVANALAAITTHSRLRSPNAYLALLTAAAAAAAAPAVADFGSVPSAFPPWLATVATAMVSQAGLWAQVYLATGLLMGAINSREPTAATCWSLSKTGATKAMIFAGAFMLIVRVPGELWGVAAVRSFAIVSPELAAALFGALAFPLAKTVIESFDGSASFVRRLVASYGDPILYLRGGVVGLGIGYAVAAALSAEPAQSRVLFGFAVGVVAAAGVNLLRDLARNGGRTQPGRAYLVQGLMGGAIGAALGFYFDSAQVQAVGTKFAAYLAVGTGPTAFDVHPILSKWGRVNLGEVTGGVNLLFAESLAGVIEWSIPAWLFALNRTFLAAYFQKDATPIRALFTRDGLIALTDNMLAVFRWGLWMSPIIKSFLRPVGEPTWYNQDGAVRTLLAAYQDATLSDGAFRAWSLQVFVSLLAYDAVRVLIWLDHMGLRVATLVNLSFLGMDRLDARLARFLAPAATARCMPEAVKRFTTWAPLLIPFYIPRGDEWDIAWERSQTLQRQAGAGPLAAFNDLSSVGQSAVIVAAVAACTVLFAARRRLHHRHAGAAVAHHALTNAAYEVVLRANGEVFSQERARGYDVTRRSYDRIDPSGRILFVVDGATAWPVIGNFPADRAARPHVVAGGDALRCVSDAHGLRTTVGITLPGAADAAELWTIAVENATDAARTVQLVPYVEWVMNRPDADRGHTQYNRLFAEMEYAAALHAILAWDKHSRAMGVLAADLAPKGFLTARVDFIGRARSVWAPRAVETLSFTEPRDEAAHPTLDPIGCLLLEAQVPPRGSIQIRLLIGLASERAAAIDLIARHLQLPGAAGAVPSRDRKATHRIGHGEVPPGAPRPYAEFSADGRRLRVLTPFTPRPFDHTMSNARGHVVAVTNRGLHTSASVNAQQNRLTPDCPDTVTREVPGEAFYLFDPDRGEWFSPTFHPLNDATADYEAEFGVDGTAAFRASRGSVEMELTVFVPADEPVGVYVLTVRNRGDAARRLRVVPYFQMVLSAQPESAGPLVVRRDAPSGALFFENPRNAFRTGPAFVAMSPPAERVETNRGRFFGTGRGVARPAFVESGEPDGAAGDDRPVAALLTTLSIPAGGESAVVVLLGQADDRAEAQAVIRRFRSAEAARGALDATRRWWLNLMGAVRVETNRAEFDRYLDWMKYQALAERIWARRGFYQASGAFGFRDQLQDAVNLMWADPTLARRQILLHAAQQFVEGDVVHWFHRLQDGRTGFVGRTHASDNLLWLPWAVVEYVTATGDESLLVERAPYLESDLPFAPLPAGKHGMGFDPLRSARDDTVYCHCLKAIDLVLDTRMGAHGLPLMGTGDWNDGLDEIGSRGRGESVWLGLFLCYILERMAGLVGRCDGPERQRYCCDRLANLRAAVEATWRGDRYLRAIHDDGTEIGVAGSGVWEIDALTAAWAVMAGMNHERARTGFDTAVSVLERDTTILLGYPPLREDTTPYLGRSSWYPEGVRENGMYCHGEQWLVGAARILAERCATAGDAGGAAHYRDTAYRLWLKVSAIPHTTPAEIETYGGQPNKQAADMVTTFDPGRMIWNGYTGAAGWMFRQALEGVLGLRLAHNEVVAPVPAASAGALSLVHVSRNLPTVVRSPAFGRPPTARKTA